jgi:hypothetical protein
VQTVDDEATYFYNIFESGQPFFKIQSKQFFSSISTRSLAPSLLVQREKGIILLLKVYPKCHDHTDLEKSFKNFPETDYENSAIKFNLPYSI